MSLITEDVKAKAEVHHGDELCQVKSKELLKEMGLPTGLLPLKDVEECGHVRETGFVWLKQKKSITHKFEKIGEVVSYASEVTAQIEKGKIKKLTGVKVKELLLWITITEIYMDDPPTDKITFKTPVGFSSSYPVSAFEIEEKGKDVKEEKAKDVKEEKAKDVKEDKAKDVKEELAKDVKEEKAKEDKDVKEIKEEAAPAPVEVKEV